MKNSELSSDWEKKSLPIEFSDSYFEYNFGKTVFVEDAIASNVTVGELAKTFNKQLGDKL